MYSDLFEQIDAARNGRRGGRSGGGGTESTSVPEPTPLVSFKAGKMKLVQQPEDTSSSVPVVSYKCEPDTSRGEVRMIWNTSLSKVQWQWYDRRSKKVLDTYTITEAGSTFERIDLYKTSKKHKHDRIYVWSKKEGADDATTSATMKYDMYWMQDASDEKDDEIVAKVNQYLADPDSAAPEGTVPAAAAATATTTSTSVSSSSRSTTAAATSRSAGTIASSSQVDALSSILENLGMPQGDTSASTSGANTTSGTVSSGPKQLTLADLQGAMAGIQAASTVQQRTTGPPLTDIVHSPEAISAILESDEAVQQRLIALLPEGQQTPEHLSENLRSPQVQQTLRTLTQALLPDDNGDLSGYASIIANFSLDPSDGQQTLSTTGNSIQAFLDCIIKSVEKEQAAAVDAEESAGTGTSDTAVDDAAAADETNTNEEKSDE